jgi:hypothetical protein
MYDEKRGAEVNILLYRAKDDINRDKDRNVAEGENNKIKFYGYQSPNKHIHDQKKIITSHIIVFLLISISYQH